MKTFTAILFLTVFLFEKGVALSCYQCGKTGLTACEETVESLPLDACPSTKDLYCIFLNETVNNQYVTVQRFCSPTTVTDCNDVPDPPQVEVVTRSCRARSCTDDGCNSSSTLKISAALLLVTAIVALLWQDI